jgi:hypothetical protein
MSNIGIAIREPEIMIPWERSWDVHTGIIIADTSLTGIQNYELNPRVHGYRGPGAAFDPEDRGWSSGDRDGVNYMIGHRIPDYWGYFSLGNWIDGPGTVYGDVAVDRARFVWTGNPLGVLLRFDPISQLTTSFQIGSQIKGISVDRYGFIWVAQSSFNVMRKFDSAGNQIGNPVPVGSLPMGFGDMTGYEFGRKMTAIAENPPSPEAITLLAAYPNPFNASTLIRYSLAKPGSTNLAIYNLLGQLVATLYDGNLEAGEHNFVWNANNFVSGIYFVKIKSADYSDQLKIVLIK